MVMMSRSDVEHAFRAEMRLLRRAITHFSSVLSTVDLTMLQTGFFLAQQFCKSEISLGDCRGFLRDAKFLVVYLGWSTLEARTGFFRTGGEKVPLQAPESRKDHHLFYLPLPSINTPLHYISSPSSAHHLISTNTLHYISLPTSPY